MTLEEAAEMIWNLLPTSINCSLYEDEVETILGEIADVIRSCNIS